MTAVYNKTYQYIKGLGEGAFGKVFLAKEDHSEKLVAIKEFKSANSYQQKSILQEIQTISRFHREHIVGYMTNFTQDGKFFLVLEYCEQGDLWNVSRSQKLNNKNIINYVRDVANEIHFLHKKNIIHRDIKPANLLLSKSGVIKIADFGIANTLGGTRSYLSPEALNYDSRYFNDPRVDIYSLGVTMMELLTGRNPFQDLSKDQILSVHEKGDFPINELAKWQQDIILKAIHKVPELRFQSMHEMVEAIEAKHVPFIINKSLLEAGSIIEDIKKRLGWKRWRDILPTIEEAEKKYPEVTTIKKLKGDYYLRANKTEMARTAYENALQLNRRIDIQKEMGALYVAEKQFSKAISMLNDHINRNPSDLEAYNLLLQAYYETGRYESGMDLAEIIIDKYEGHPCFVNNHLVCNIMQGNGKQLERRIIRANDENPFALYNRGVFEEKLLSHNYLKKPSIKSKLLFMEYRFKDLKNHKLYVRDNGSVSNLKGSLDSFIISIGRAGFKQNTVQLPGGNSISRRHCVIINSSDDVWLCDLNSTGVFVDEKKVNNRVPLIGVHTIKIGNTSIQLATSKDKLI